MNTLGIRFWFMRKLAGKNSFSINTTIETNGEVTLINGPHKSAHFNFTIKPYDVDGFNVVSPYSDGIKWYTGHDDDMSRTVERQIIITVDIDGNTKWDNDKIFYEYAHVIACDYLGPSCAKKAKVVMIEDGKTVHEEEIGR